MREAEKLVYAVPKIKGMKRIPPGGTKINAELRSSVQ